MSATHRALVLSAPGRLEFTDVPTPTPPPGHVNVRLHAAALNHRDVWIQKGQYAGIVYPSIPGSDGAGVVEALGEGVADDWQGRAVLLNPNIDWGDSSVAQGPGYHILGVPSAGTLQQVVTLPAHRLAPKPEHLDWAAAAALPLAGLTAYRALFYHGGLDPQRPSADTKVVITGIGGGVAQLALRFAHTAVARVWVTSGTDAKLTQARQLGALGGANYRTAGWAKALKTEIMADGGRAADLVVDSTGSDALNDALELLRPGGSLVLYGATAGLPSGLNLRRIFWNQLRIQGSTMGSDADFAAMAEFVSRHRLVPPVDSVRPFDQALEAFERMAAAGQSGKLVLSFDEPVIKA